MSHYKESMSLLLKSVLWNWAQVIELNHNAWMAKLQVIQGRDKWVHMRWLS